MEEAKTLYTTILEDISKDAENADDFVYSKREIWAHDLTTYLQDYLSDDTPQTDRLKDEALAYIFNSNVVLSESTN